MYTFFRKTKIINEAPLETLVKVIKLARRRRGTRSGRKSFGRIRIHNYLLF